MPTDQARLEAAVEALASKWASATPLQDNLVQGLLRLIREQGKGLLAVAVPLSIAIKIVAVAHGDQGKAAAIATESDKAKIVFGLGVQLLIPLLILVGIFLSSEVSDRSTTRAVVHYARKKLGLPTPSRTTRVLSLGVDLALLVLLALSVRLVSWPVGSLLLGFGVLAFLSGPLLRLRLRRSARKAQGVPANDDTSTVSPEPEPTPFTFIALLLMMSFLSSCLYALDDRPWLPPNNVTVDHRTYVAYVLSEESGNITLLQESSRNVIYLKEQDVTKREICRDRSGGPGRSLEAIFFTGVRDERPKCASKRL